MIDTMTNQRLQVGSGGKGTSWIHLPVSQLAAVQQLLNSNGISHWVSEGYMSYNGGPETVLLYMRRGTDPAPVQALLDSIP